MDGLQMWQGADAVGRAVGLLLLAMSVTTWALIGWKAMSYWRARRSLKQALPSFWAAPDWEAGRAALSRFDAERLLLPLLDAAQGAPRAGATGSLGGQLPDPARLTRPLRDALHVVLGRLQAGQGWLASIGATAPFVGLLGTVWGIYQALHGLSMGGALSIERIAGPVGEALVMTAAGLVVAIPAVLAYNAFTRQLNACEAELEGFAHDLRAALQ
ncbi:MotA/TolQ/ExbB proton channel family protein [Inhella sp.]|uniref:MotA/TolQ/ExbB proton channel family protein n=1 Tax=Inhella sp. TaxID=1921806 RepID=UPI0035B03A5D